MGNKLIIGGIYRHFKGNEYEVLDIAKDCENLENIVVYKALYGEMKTWVRRESEFLSEVDHDKYPDVIQKWRFEYQRMADTSVVESKEVRWELSDRMFSEKNMYSFVKHAATEHNLSQTMVSLDEATRLHANQTRKGADNVPYIYHPLMIACHALSLGFVEDDLIATALLHDTIEDCNVTADDLPVGEAVKEAVELLTYRELAGKSKDESKQIYYDGIKTNRLSVIVKVLDRCNNISTMTTGFPRERIPSYIDETEKYVMPLLDIMKYDYEGCNDAAFILKYQMKAVLESLKRII